VLYLGIQEVAFSGSRLFEKSLAGRFRGNPRRCLLPNVTSIDWCSIEDENDIAPFYSLLSPSLTKLKFWLYLRSPWTAKVTDLIDTIESHCPLIHELNLFTMWEAADARAFADSISSIFFSRRGLRILALEARVFASLLAMIPVLPELSELDLSGEYDTDDAAHLGCVASRSSALFPALTELHGSHNTEPIHFFAKFLPVVGHLLQSLRISGGSGDHPPPDLPRLIEVMAEPCVVLKALCIHVTADPAPPKLLHPLFHHLNLTSLHARVTLSIHHAPSPTRIFQCWLRSGPI
jgi:hypothetical protein